MVEQRSPKPCVVGSSPTRPVRLLKRVDMIGKIRNFISEVVVELKKVAWSTKREIIDATWIVIVSSVVLGVYIGGADLILAKVLGFIVR